MRVVVVAVPEVARAEVLPVIAMSSKMASERTAVTSRMPTISAVMTMAVSVETPSTAITSSIES